MYFVCSCFWKWRRALGNMEESIAPFAIQHFTLRSRINRFLRWHIHSTDAGRNFPHRPRVKRTKPTGPAIVFWRPLGDFIDGVFYDGNFHQHRQVSRLPPSHEIHIVYVIESAAYGVLCTSCLCQKPERARNERVRVFDTNNEWIKPRTKHFLCRELFITHNMRIFIKIVFWTRIRNKNSLTIEPNANLI